MTCGLREEINIVFGTGVNIRRRSLICDTLTRKERDRKERHYTGHGKH